MRMSRILRNGLCWALVGLPTLSCSEVSDPGDSPVPDGTFEGPLVASHSAAAAFESIPAAFLDYVRDNYRILYGHTSHGSQVMTGVQMLAAQGSQHAIPDFHEVGDDLGHLGDVSWAQVTRDFLDAHPGQYNVVMWSWCGGVSDNTEAGIQTYLDAMTQLEAEYPDVLFVYMTGHLDGTGPTGNLYVRNDQIRAFAAANDKVLFDFADVESYDPAGNYYPNESDACGWCSSWCSANACPACGSCAHSHCFNCYQKGKAFWWMMARIAGWEG